MLQDRLVCGINNDQMQKRLLLKPKLTLEKAMKIAHSVESAVQNVRQLQSVQPVQEAREGVHKVGSLHTRERSAITCYWCGKTGHQSARCRHKGAKCHSCGKVGHPQAVCRSKPSQDSEQPRSQQPHSVRQVKETEEPHLLFTLPSACSRPWKTVVETDRIPPEMEVDTGASLSLVAEDTYRRHWAHRELQQSQVRLCTYLGEPLEGTGSLRVRVRHGGQDINLPLTVVKGNGSSLLWIDWLELLRIDWEQVRQISASALERLLDSKKNLFEIGLGTLQGFKAKIHVDSAATPKFCKPRQVPYAMQEMMETELDRLLAKGIIEPVKFADWAAPIAPVMKSGKEFVCICGDYKLTANVASKLEQYPIPRVEDLFTTVAGGKFFTKLDMSHGYQQIEMDDASKQYVVIIHTKGFSVITGFHLGYPQPQLFFKESWTACCKGSQVWGST